MFERFTEQARRVIFFARYESSDLGSPEIQPEHLLLGLMRENHSLFASVPRVADRFRAQLVRHELKSPVSVDLPLSDSSKRCLKVAESEARRLGQSFIGTEHLLLGILLEEEAPASRFLTSAGFSAKQIESGLNDRGSRDTVRGLGSGSSATRTPSIPFSPLTLHAVAFALEEAQGAGRTTLSDVDLLLGLLRTGSGQAFQILTDSGVTVDAIRSSVSKLSES